MKNFDATKLEAIRRKTSERLGSASFAMRFADDERELWSWASEGSIEATRPIWSISKSFIATLTLLAHERGLLSFEDRICEYVGDGPEWVKEASLWDLLCHRSGLADYGYLEEYKSALRAHPEKAFSREDLWALVFAQGAQFDRGASFLYANVGYAMVAEALEKVFGRAFGEILQREICEPLRLRDTFEWRTPEDLKRAAPGVSLFWGEPRDPRGIYSVGWSAHPQILSNTRDVLEFFKAVFTGRVLNEDSVRRIHNPYRIDYSHKWYNPSYGPGFLGDVRSRFGSVLGNNGGGPGYSSSIYCRENGERVYAAVILGTDEFSAEDVALEMIEAQT